MKKTVIIGGGLSGLTTAFALLEKKPGAEVVILESENRAGGKIWTERSGGFLCEKGANGFLDNKPKTIELCKSLGIDPVRSNENSKKRFLLVKGMLHALPESPPAFLRSGLISWPGKLRMLYEYIAPKGPEDETVADFILRRLGREALEKLIDPMTSGIYAGDPYRMSIKSCFPRIKELEMQYGGLFRALLKIQKEKKKRQKESGEKVSVAPGGTLTSFHDGAQVMIDALTDKLGSRLRTGVSVTGISRRGSGYQVHSSSDTLDADVVVLASPAYAAAEILRDLDREMTNTLSEIPYPHVAVVCFGYRKEMIGHPLNGFGFLVPHIEGRRILGSLWDSSIFPNRAAEGQALLRTMVGGAKAPEMASLSDEKIISAVFDELKPLLSLKADPEMVKIYRWEKAIPQYLLGHSAKLTQLDSRLSSFPGLYLTGNAYRGIGMNDCIENGYRIADEIAARLSGN